MGLSELVLIIIANVLIGGCIGMTGIAGFLLPLIYSSVLGYGYYESMALSFFAFLISGAVGSMRYQRIYEIDTRIKRCLAAGSLAGAAAAVAVNPYIQEKTAFMLLYIMVLISGLTNLFPRQESQSGTGWTEKLSRKKVYCIILTGVFCGLVCALSGAGGPVLMVPILMLIGIGTHEAIGISLFSSIFIAIPVITGFSAYIDIRQLLPLFFVSGASHLAGIFVGSHLSGRIPEKKLKLFIAVFSVIIAMYKICSI